MINSKKEINKIKTNVNATLSFEGLKPSKVANYANKKMLSGELSGDDARMMILSQYNLVAK